MSRTNRRRVFSSLAEICRGNTSGFLDLMFCTIVAGAADIALRVVPSHLAWIWQARSQWPKISSCDRLAPPSRLYVHFSYHRCRLIVVPHFASRSMGSKGQEGGHYRCKLKRSHLSIGQSVSRQLVPSQFSRDRVPGGIQVHLAPWLIG